MIHLLSFTVIRNPAPNLSSRMIAPMIARCDELRHFAGVRGECLEKRDQHGDDHLVSPGGVELHADESLPVVVEECTELDGVLPFRRDYYLSHIHPSLRSAPTIAAGSSGVTGAGA